MPETPQRSQSSGPSASPKATGRACALIVDDEQNVRAMLVELLSGVGFDCLEACDAEEALALLDVHSPSLGVLDLALPGMSGAELAWRMKEKKPDLPLVALSGKLKKWDADDLNDLGFARIFSKPMDCDEFLRVCRRFAGATDGENGVQQ